MSDSSDDSIYHEKQSKELCALHALNNLFQNPKAFTKDDLDQICMTLSPQNWLNPHRSMLGMGNYDINVIITALQNKAFETFWFDRRRDPSIIDFDKVEGFILNVPSQFKIGKHIPTPIRRKHWLAIRQICGSYYNLDSKLNYPELIGSDKELLDYLREVLLDAEKELLVVVPCCNSINWMKQPS